jgi:Asp-tRNA(Asn)/Glu-tRNA(Gln) amidotransferase A subunit family amidase
MPAVAVPSGVNEAGLPLAVQLVARFWADEALLAWAREVEAALTRC